MPDLDQTALAEMTTGIVAADVARNAVWPADMPGLISSVHVTLGDLRRAATPPPAAVPPSRSGSPSRTSSSAWRTAAS